MLKLNQFDISLTLPGQAISVMPLSKLESIYCLSVGSDVLANDSSCYLLVFPDEMWLLPDSTKGISVLKQVGRTKGFSAKVNYAIVDYLPYSWRTKWLIFPGTEANLKVISRDQLVTVVERLTIIDRGKYEHLFLL